MDSLGIGELSLGEPLSRCLDTLPLEIQQSIFRLLDPAGLVSVSQASKLFRQITNPQGVHFLERLLAWECTSEYGGPPCNTSLARNLPLPGWDSDPWNDARFACGGCLKLRRHTDFRYKYIARLRFKKPCPGSPPSQLLTSWEPSRREGWGRRSRKQRKVMEKLTPPEWKLRLRWAMGGYHEGISYVAIDGIGRRTGDGLDTHLRYGCEGFRGMSSDEWSRITPKQERALMEKEVAKIEYEHAGFDRHLRRCHTCLLLDNSGATLQGNGITKPTMKTIIRALTFSSTLERWFPGIFLNESLPRPPVRRSRVSCLINGTRDVWGMGYVMCLTCRAWKEARSFRGDYFGDRRPADSMLRSKLASCKPYSCYQCTAKEPRGRDEVGDSLRHRLITICEADMKYLQSRLMRSVPPKLPAGDGPSTAERAPTGPVDTPIRSEIWDLETMQEVIRRCIHSLELSNDRRLQHWQDPSFDDRKQLWGDIFEYWTWLGNTATVIAKDPEPLTEWMLARHGAELGVLA